MSKPPYKPTAANRRRVSIIAGAGWAHEEIAICLGIARNTLEKYFAFELTVGAYERHAEVIEAMHKSAENGNATAQRAYSALSPRVAAPPLPAEAADAHKGVPEGKKEQAQAAAVSAHTGTDWESLLNTGQVQ